MARSASRLSVSRLASPPRSPGASSPSLTASPTTLPCPACTCSCTSLSPRSPPAICSSASRSAETPAATTRSTPTASPPRWVSLFTKDTPVRAAFGLVSFGLKVPPSSSCLETSRTPAPFPVPTSPMSPARSSGDRCRPRLPDLPPRPRRADAMPRGCDGSLFVDACCRDLAGKAESGEFVGE